MTFRLLRGEQEDSGISQPGGPVDSISVRTLEEGQRLVVLKQAGQPKIELPLAPGDEFVDAVPLMEGTQLVILINGRESGRLEVRSAAQQWRVPTHDRTFEVDQFLRSGSGLRGHRIFVEGVERFEIFQVIEQTLQRDCQSEPRALRGFGGNVEAPERALLFRLGAALRDDSCQWLDVYLEAIDLIDCKKVGEMSLGKVRGDAPMSPKKAEGRTLNVKLDTLDLQVAWDEGGDGGEPWIKSPPAGAYGLTKPMESLAHGSEPFWPLPLTQAKVLHAFGTPHDRGGIELHRGVDLWVEDPDPQVGMVAAARSGTIGSVHPTQDGGTLSVAGRLRSKDTYMHLNVCPVSGRGDEVAAGAWLGSVNRGHSSSDGRLDHLHWESSDGSPLKLFVAPHDRDPGERKPEVGDTDLDGMDLRVVGQRDREHRKPAWGSVDLIVEAYDRLSSDPNLRVNPAGIGYWIEGVSWPGSDVRSAGNPYRLVRFDGPLCNLDYYNLNDILDLTAPATVCERCWPVYLSWILTNATDETGAPGSAKSCQNWKTNARRPEAGENVASNGWDAADAREIQEAMFPDGLYRAHILLEDWYPESHTTATRTVDIQRNVVVDNFRPYVKYISISGEKDGQIYKAEWSWNADQKRLEISPSQRPEVIAQANQKLEIEVGFSEPMRDASIKLELDKFPSEMESKLQHPWQRTRWFYSEHIKAGSNGPLPIVIDGHDLAGTPVVPSTEWKPRTDLGPREEPVQQQSILPGELLHQISIH